MRACAFCGSSLEGQRRHAVYCSGACRAAASRARAESRTRPPEALQSAHDAPPIRWQLPRDADEFIAAVIAAFPGSYELTENERGRAVPGPGFPPAVNKGAAPA